MKYFIILFLLIPLAMFSQTEAKQSEFTVYSVDTLGVSDTVILEFLHTNGRSVDFKQTYDYSFIITADSLSGANDGTIYLQYSNTPYGETAVWHNAETTTIDGTTQQVIYYSGTLLTRRARIYYLTPAGAKSIRVATQGIAKRKNYK